MNASLLPVLSALALLSCSILEPELPLGEFRLAGRSTGVSGVHNSSSGSRTDTVFLVSAVSFPSSYDWQRDSSYGAVACTLRFYRGRNVAAVIPAGKTAQVDVSPDRHHIVGGSLFTEYADSRGTVVKKDGKALASWKERETLLGLLYKDGVLHTVGRLQSGGFTYRKDGKIILKIDNGSVLGGFSDDGYGPEGALYEDGGYVCFGYKVASDGTESAYLVVDGSAGMLLSAPGVTVLDARMLGGKPALLYNQGKTTILSRDGKKHNFSYGGAAYWQKASIVLLDGSLAIVGFSVDSVYGQSFLSVGKESGYFPFFAPADYVYCDGETCTGISRPPKGYGDCYFFHRNCACRFNGDMAMVLTPKDGSSPFMVYGGKKEKFNIHGYLSGVAVQIIK